MSKPRLLVCISCRNTNNPDQRPGRDLLTLLQAALPENPSFTLEATECLSVCKRPATVALASPTRYSYIFADL